LIEAAVRRFYRDGFRNVGIDQVYSEIGISKTAFYKHFESNEDLMLVLYWRSKTAGYRNLWGP
jgi:AcrR family transcriptional regulator